MSLVQRCPYFGVSFKRGSTVYDLHNVVDGWGTEGDEGGGG